MTGVARNFLRTFRSAISNWTRDQISRDRPYASNFKSGVWQWAAWRQRSTTSKQSSNQRNAGHRQIHSL